MANKKFSEFVLKTSTSDVSHIVGYNGAENVQITPANFVTGGGTGVFLPLAGGTMVGNTIHNDNVKSIYGNPGNDLEIYHDGNNSKITESGSGGLYIGSSVLGIQNSTHSETMAIFTPNSSVELYYDNSKKFETTSSGVKVTSEGYQINIEDISSGNISEILTSNTAMGFFADRANSVASTSIIFSVDNTTALTIDDGQNATFAGNVNTRRLFAEQSGADIIDMTRTSVGTYRFAISGTNSFSLFDVGANSDRLTVDASGNLGLGSSAPTSKFEIEQSIVPRITMIKTGILSWYVGNPTQGASTNFTIGTDSGGNIDILNLTSSGNLGVGTATPTGKVGIEANGNHLHLRANTATAGKYWNFDITSNNQLFIINNTGLGLNITDSGNVGIGVTASAKLDVLVGNDERLLFTNVSSKPIISAVNASNGSYKTLQLQGSDLYFMVSGTERMRLNSDGHLLVGTTAKETQGVTIYGSGANGMYVKTTGTCAYMVTNSGGGGTDTSGVFNTFYNDTVIAGSITLANANTIAYNTTSDYRLKEDLQDFKGLDLVSKIPVYDYKWKADKSRSYGVMAHELEEVLPQAVTGDKDAEEMQSVDYSKIVPLLVKSIQELSAKLEALECQCEKK